MRDFVIITKVNERYLDELEKKLHFRQNLRINFVGTEYDQELLMKIHKNSYGYLHGYEVGGTPLSLLEALRCTDLNLFLDVDFNREVAEDVELYWTKEEGNLAALVEKTGKLDFEIMTNLGKKANQRITIVYSW